MGHTRLTHGHLMLRKDQQPTCRNVAYGNQRPTIKHCLQECSIVIENITLKILWGRRDKEVP